MGNPRRYRRYRWCSQTMGPSSLQSEMAIESHSYDFSNGGFPSKFLLLISVMRLQSYLCAFVK
jgi:hypothetical protein